MSDELNPLAEGLPAPAPGVTASPENANLVPENTESIVEDKPEEKKFTQAEIDAMISKRLAREQRKWEREQQVRFAQSQDRTQVPAELPPADQFETPEAYAEALAERKAQQIVQQKEAAKHQAEIMEKFHEKEEEVRSKYDDFDQVAYNPNLPITDVMAETIRASDIGPELAYHLGSNPKEAERIARLSPYLQAKEIGKIEAKLAENPPVKKTSSAPAPITPVKARSTISGVIDTTDPRSIQSMSTSEWIEAERRRQIEKVKAQRSR